MGTELSVGERSEDERRPRRLVVVSDRFAGADAGPVSQVPAWRLNSAANPLLIAAGPLLAFAGRLDAQTDAAAVRAELTPALRRFIEDAAAAGCSAASIRSGRHALTALVKDLFPAAVLDPGDLGPESFYERLEALGADPEAHWQELELFHACLALGFEGSYRLRRGDRDPDRIRSELYRTLRRRRGPVERSLAPPSPIRPKVGPLWPTIDPRWWALIPVLPLLLLWFALSGAVVDRAKAVARRIDGMVPSAVAIEHRGPPPESAGPALAGRVADVLAVEIQGRTLSVLAGTDGALVIRVSGAGMFPVDGDTVSARHRAVFDRIAQALAPETGRIAVMAHLDDVFAPTPRFPSPDALTQARAEAVRRLLEARIAPERLSAQGRGMSEPVALNSDAAGRTANRRIDIRLYPF